MRIFICPMIIQSKAYHAQNNCHKQLCSDIKKSIFSAMLYQDMNIKLVNLRSPNFNVPALKCLN